tara:strand:- start:2494 stop:4107 length:1614 start_codon:yes stop_codon:yes gene_type:complete
MRDEKQPTPRTKTSDDTNNNGTTIQTTTLRSHPVVASSSSSVLVKPLPPTPVKRARRPLLKDDDDDSKDFYGFRRHDFRFAPVKDDDEEKKTTERTKERDHLNACWETNELARCARDISIATFVSEAAASDDDDFLYGKRWKKAVKARKGKLLEKTVRTFGAPKEKRGEIWYELSGARQFADMAKESYERLVERAEEEDGREMLSASKASSSSFRGGSKQKKKNGRKTTKSDEDDDDDDDDDEDDDTTYNVHRDGSERSKSEKKRAKEEWAMQIDLDVDRTFPENDIFRTHGKEALRRILRAYSRRNPKTGYCQGMNYIAAFIWLAVRNSDSFNASSSSSNNSRSEADDDDKKDEEAIEKTAFWIFTAALDGHALCREIHARDLRGTVREFGVLHSILTWRNKRLSRYLDDIGVDFACCEPRWLVCVFLESFPSETVARIFDSLFANGFKVWHRVAVSQILKCEKEILKCQSLPEVAGCIRAQLERSDDAEEVMERAFALRNFRSGKIAQLRRKVVQKLDQEREQRFNTTNSAGGRR